MDTCQLQTKRGSFPIQPPSGSSKTTTTSQLTILTWNIAEHLPDPQFSGCKGAKKGPSQKPPDSAQIDAVHSLPLQATAEGRR